MKTFIEKELEIPSADLIEFYLVIKSTRIIIKYTRRAFVYIRLISEAQIEIFIKPNKYKIEKH